MLYLPVGIVWKSFLDAEVSLCTLTALIVYRIWSVQKATPYSPNEKTPLSRAIRILVKSGMIYTASVIILFAVYLLGNNADYGVSDAVRQLFCYVTPSPL